MHTLLDVKERQTLVRLINSDPVDWIERNFYIPDPRNPHTGELLMPGPIRLHPIQKRLLREALTKRNGRFPYSTVVYSTIKKSGKTRVAAAVAAWFADTQGAYNEIYCLANDGKQSADRILDAIKQSVQLNTDMDWHATRTKITLPSGTFIEAIPCDPTGQAGANPGLTVWCLDGDTEVLTKRGWQTHQTLGNDDLVATLSPDGTFEWQQPRGVYRAHYEGPLYYAQNRRVDIAVTPGHRVYSKEGVCTAREAAQVPRLTLCVGAVSWLGSKPISDGTLVEIPASPMKPALQLPLDHWVRFFGWHIAEGYIRRDNSVDITQSRQAHPEHYQEIVDIIRALGLECKCKPNHILVYDVRLGRHLKRFGRSYEKYLPRWLKELPRRYLVAFLEAYLKGDGHRVAGTGAAYYCTTASEKLADDLAEIGIKCGWYISQGEEAPTASRAGDRTYYRVYFNPARACALLQRKDWEVRHYEGPVFCPSTSNGVILIRRHGRLCWTGNSEMWGYRHEQKERLWTEMTVPPTRYGRALRWVESYAGYAGESNVLYNLYAIGAEQGKRSKAFPDLPVYVNEAANMMCYWDTGDAARRMPWQTQDYYTQEAQILPPSEFDRIHRNKWISPVTKAIPLEWWDACKGRIPPLDKRTPVVMGVDAAISGDCCACVLVSRNTFPKLISKHTMIRAVRVWAPPRGGKIDLTDTVEKTLREWVAQYNVVMVTYDEYQLHKMMNDIRKEGIVRTYPFGQVRPRCRADKQLFDMIVQRYIMHDGNLVLREHVNNAAATTDGEKYRFIKPKRSRGVLTRQPTPIDALVATSMANEECLRLTLG